MSKQDQATSNLVSPRTREWCREAQRIVAHPEDYGMNRRQQVRGLERMLARRVRVARAVAPAPARLWLPPTTLAGGAADLEGFSNRPAA